jgi:hypothetical protein
MKLQRCRQALAIARIDYTLEDALVGGGAVVF